MRIRKFQAANMREALALVRQEFGSEAMVVATKEVRRGLLGTGIEVTAALDVEDPEPQHLEARPQAVPPSTALSEMDVERIMAPLRSELRSLRSMLRPTTPSPSEVLRTEVAELRAVLTRLGTRQVGVEPALSDVAAAHRIATPSTRRVVALVGPTGVGKTTTIAKLAARAALVERKAVALVTLDTYRVGGEDQLRAFADLIGVPLTLVPDPLHLASTVATLANFDRVYIDTAGRSPRDAVAIAELARGFARIADLEVHLTVPATSHAALIDITRQRCREIAIDRILFTKLDEAPSDLAELVRAPARLGVPVSHFTVGQRIPEDIEDATAERLLSLATSGLYDTAHDETEAVAP